MLGIPAAVMTFARPVAFPPTIARPVEPLDAGTLKQRHGNL